MAVTSGLGLRQRDFLKELDHTRDELQLLVDLAADLKRDHREGFEVPRLQGKNIALIFEKSSTRTRCAFEVAARHQGASTTYLDPSSTHIGTKESPADTALVLARMFDAIEFRGAAQATVEELAEHSSVPVYNGLTDEWHPTQMLADLLTMAEHSSKPFGALSYAYLGDARFNMGRSLLVTGAIMGCDVRICAPQELWPDAGVIAAAHERAAESGARIVITDDPAEALPGVDFVHTDVWLSMGEPADAWSARAALLRPYQVNGTALELTGNPDVKFMHCLPALHDARTVVGGRVAELTGMTGGLEVTDDVFRSAANVAFDQAENRLHTIKALLVATLGVDPT